MKVKGTLGCSSGTLWNRTVSAKGDWRQDLKGGRFMQRTPPSVLVFLLRSWSCSRCNEWAVFGLLSTAVNSASVLVTPRCPLSPHAEAPRTWRILLTQVSELPAPSPPWNSSHIWNYRRTSPGQWSPYTASFKHVTNPLPPPLFWAKGNYSTVYRLS